MLDTDIDEIIDLLPRALWDRFSGKRVLITGSRGFLGRYFVRTFVRLNERTPYGKPPVEVLSIDNLVSAGPYGEAEHDYPHIAFVNHDVTKSFKPEKPVDFILHCAGIASPAWYRKYPVETYSVSIAGTRNVLDIANASRDAGRDCRMLFFSSSEIYGDPDAAHVPTAESYRGNVACHGPRACYDIGKRAGEMMVHVEHQLHGTHAMCVRPFNFFGPGMQRTDYRVLPNFAARWVDGQPLHVYGTGKQTRTYCYVTDGIRGCIQALLEGVAGEPYNIGNPTPEISVLDLAQKVAEITGTPLVSDTVEHPDTYPADEPQRRCPDITKAQAQLGYAPQVKLDDGLRRFFGWAETAFREQARR